MSDTPQDDPSRSNPPCQSLRVVPECDAQYRRLLDGITDAFVSVDMSGRVLESNRAYQNLTGYDAEELARKTYFELTPPRWHEMEARRVREQIPSRGYSDTYEKEYLRKDGSLVPVEQRTLVLRDDEGRPVAIWAIIANITSRKCLEEEQRRALHLAQNVLDSLSAHICVLDECGAIVAVNRAWQQFALANGPVSGELGVGADYFRVCQAATGDDEPVARRMLDGIRAVAAGELQDFSIEYACHSPTERRWFSAEVTGLGEGKPQRVVVAHSNITRRQQAEEALREREAARRESQRQLQAIVDQAFSLVYALDVEGHFTLVSRRCAEVLGHSRDELLGKTLHDVLPKSLADAHRANDLDVMTTGRPRVVEEIVDAAMGRRVYLSSRFPLLGDGGAITGVCWIATDITERKQAETERERLATAITQAAEVIVITDAQGVIQYVNPAFETTTGYSREEALGHTPRILKSGKHDEALYRTLWETIRSGSTWRGRLVSKRKDGALFTEEASISPVRDSVGAIVSYVAVKRDITRELTLEARVRTEIESHGQELLRQQRQMQERLAALTKAAHDAIIMLDNDGNIAHWNDAAEAIFGYSQTEALGRNLHQLLAPARFHANQPDAFRIFRETGLGGAVGRTVELTGLRKSGEEFPMDLSLSATRFEEKWCAVGVVRDITERKRASDALAQSELRFRTLFESSSDALLLLDGQSVFDCNLAALEMFGCPNKADLCSLRPCDISPDRQPGGADSLTLANQHLGTAMEKGAVRFEWRHKRVDDGVSFPAEVTLTRLHYGGARVLQATIRDITERTRAEEQLRHELARRQQMEVELRHAQKLEAVGHLAAGIAHEINTPAQFVSDSIQFLKDSAEDLFRLVGEYRRAVEALGAVPGHEGQMLAIRRAEEEIDLPYLEANVPSGFERCFDGISRITSIVRAMKEFAHADQREMSPADLNRALLSTLTIAKNEYKYVAETESDLDEIPLVVCHLGDLNQVFLNLIVNAAHAISEVVGNSGARGRIKITTRAEPGWVRIEFADTGVGIPEHLRDRIFEPFFTTKPVGMGTGQGLAIARAIVVDKHGGSLTFESTLGVGTTFTVRLPIDGKLVAPSQGAA